MNTLYTPELSTPVSRPFYMTSSEAKALDITMGVTVFNHRSAACTTDWYQLLTVGS